MLEHLQRVASKHPVNELPQRLRAGFGMKGSDHRDTDNDEDDQHHRLADDESRVGLRRRERIQERDLLKALGDKDEDIQIKSHDRAHDVYPAPRTHEPVAIQRRDRKDQNQQRDTANDMGRQDPIGGEEVSGHARQHRGGEKDRRPAADHLRAEHCRDHDDPGHDRDQADDNVQLRKRRYRHSENHSESPQVVTIARRSMRRGSLSFRNDLGNPRRLRRLVNHRIGVFDPAAVRTRVLLEQTHERVVMLLLDPVPLPFEQSGDGG